MTTPHSNECNAEITITIAKTSFELFLKMKNLIPSINTYYACLNATHFVCWYIISVQIFSIESKMREKTATTFSWHQIKCEAE